VLAQKGNPISCDGWFSCSLSESEETNPTARNPKWVKTDLGEKHSHRSRKTIAVQELALKKELLQEQMLLEESTS
jgi:hypothetical protein